MKITFSMNLLLLFPFLFNWPLPESQVSLGALDDFSKK